MGIRASEIFRNPLDGKAIGLFVRVRATHDLTGEHEAQSLDQLWSGERIETGHLNGNGIPDGTHLSTVCTLLK